jgi:hypothetical protein
MKSKMKKNKKGKQSALEPSFKEGSHRDAVLGTNRIHIVKWYSTVMVLEFQPSAALLSVCSRPGSNRSFSRPRSLSLIMDRFKLE